MAQSIKAVLADVIAVFFFGERDRAVHVPVSRIFFVGIVWWAWSPNRKKANEESAELPFDLPDEFSKDKS